jgi:uncharacterized membrane protein
MNNLIIGILLTIVPLSELRIGLPFALAYAKNTGSSHFLIFLLIIFLNILLIFGIFLFLDKANKFFLKWPFYKKVFELYEKKSQKKIKLIEKKYSKLGFLALVLFVSLPLPFTGVYSAAFISWALRLERKRSIMALSLGVLVAGSLTYAGTMGVLALIA